MDTGVSVITLAVGYVSPLTYHPYRLPTRLEMPFIGSPEIRHRLLYFLDFFLPDFFEEPFLSFLLFFILSSCSF